ncbi:MAG: CPBP family intramembrane metalloprotease [Chlamydiae bacterium]|nr:CPBP family intramembrane metalloprotease [Chlamydiota bacterium]
MTAAISSYIGQLATGAACGLADFLFCTTTQKICTLAGVRFEEIEDEDDIPSSERLDKQFWDMVVKYPIGEELIFRGLLQPFLSKGLLVCMPQLAAPGLWDIPIANTVSAVAIGTGFGVLHYFGYKSGGKQVALMGSVSGSFYGIIKERFGLATSISAHMIHNFMVGWLDKHYPSFLGDTSPNDPLKN